MLNATTRYLCYKRTTPTAKWELIPDLTTHDWSDDFFAKHLQTGYKARNWEPSVQWQVRHRASGIILCDGNAVSQNWNFGAKEAVEAFEARRDVAPKPVEYNPVSDMMKHQEAWDKAALVPGGFTPPKHGKRA
jgi:hypothetical protein